MLVVKVLIVKNLMKNFLGLSKIFFRSFHQKQSDKKLKYDKPHKYIYIYMLCSVLKFDPSNKQINAFRIEYMVTSNP